jgi:hypothetical protein
MRHVFVATLLVSLAGCAGPEHVTFDHGQCLIDGHAADLAEVEASQARIAQHVLDNQPIYLLVTLAIILLAGASHVEKLVLLFAARRQEAKGLAERLRAALDRYRAHPVRYFTIVGVTLALLGVAGGLYLYLDGDKRASERALGQLQFCHLALRTADEQAALAEQRKNLDALQSTTGDIKSLVATLPPEEQRKAEQLLGQMRSALGNQDRLLARSAAVAAAVRDRSDAIEKGLGAVASGVVGLKPLPEQVREMDGLLKRIEARTQLAPPGQKAPATLADAFGEVRKDVGRVDCAAARLPNGRTVGETLADLAARPPPVCRCEAAAPPPRDGGAR